MNRLNEGIKLVNNIRLIFLLNVILNTTNTDDFDHSKNILITLVGLLKNKGKNGDTSTHYRIERTH